MTDPRGRLSRITDNRKLFDVDWLIIMKRDWGCSLISSCSFLGQVLVEQELAELAVLGHHLLEGGELAGQFALSVELLLQVDAGKVVHQVVVVVGLALAGLDQLADGLGHLDLQIEGILQGAGAIGPLLLGHSLHRGIHQD